MESSGSYDIVSSGEYQSLITSHFEQQNLERFHVSVEHELTVNSEITADITATEDITITTDVTMATTTTTTTTTTREHHLTSSCDVGYLDVRREDGELVMSLRMDTERSEGHHAVHHDVGQLSVQRHETTGEVCRYFLHEKIG